MMIIKGDGNKVPFDANKVKESIRKTGAGEAIIEQVLSKVTSKMKDGMTTQDLYNLVKKELNDQSVCFSCRYSLRESVLKMGPAGFNFEYYVAAILEAHGYKTEVPKTNFQGACVDHEIDVVAEKDNRRIMIEAKFRNRKNDTVDLKDIMATWSRFLDLVDGASVGRCPHFDEVWLVTNARFTKHARKFGQCKAMHLTGWKYPKDYSFGGMVDEVALYPVTAVDDLAENEVEDLAKSGLLLCKDLEQTEPEDLSERLNWKIERAKNLIGKCSAIVNGDENKN